MLNMNLPFPLLLDRDGTVIVDRHYLCNPDDIVLEDGAITGLRALVAAGAVPVIATNQSGVGRGMFGIDAVHAVHERLDRILRAEGVVMAGYYFCPHVQEDHCSCRKPQPGLARQAALDLGLDLAHAVVIGDKMSDLGLARAIGARGILVRTGKGATCAAAAAEQGFEVADNLIDASLLLLRDFTPGHDIPTGNALGADKQERESKS